MSTFDINDINLVRPNVSTLIQKHLGGKQRVWTEKVEQFYAALQTGDCIALTPSELILAASTVKVNDGVKWIKETLWPVMLKGRIRVRTLLDANYSHLDMVRLVGCGLLYFEGESCNIVNEQFTCIFRKILVNESRDTLFLLIDQIIEKHGPFDLSLIADTFTVNSAMSGQTKIEQMLHQEKLEAILKKHGFVKKVVAKSNTISTSSPHIDPIVEEPDNEEDANLQTLLTRQAQLIEELGAIAAQIRSKYTYHRKRPRLETVNEMD
jgi:hypothetical protein